MKNAIYTLNICDRFSDIIAFSNHIEKQYDLSQSGNSCFYQYYRMCYARAHLHGGDKTHARNTFESLRIINFPPNMNYYFQINIHLIEIDFLLDKNKKQEAMTLIDEIGSIAKQLDFKYFQQRADLLESRINT